MNPYPPSGKLGRMAKDPRKPHNTILHLVSSLRHAVPPIHRQARPFVIAGVVIGVLGFRFKAARWLGFGFAAASAFFFRTPHRVAPSDPKAILAPADGEVCVVDWAVPPAELGMGNDPLPRVGIFLSVLNVHVQRAPITGTVTTVRHTPGRFLPADDKQAGDANERTGVRLTTDSGVAVGVVQIAGMIARRIVCDVEEGQRVERGETYGLIRFGSRVDTYLPGVAPRVEVGQTMIGGESVIGVLS